MDLKESIPIMLYDDKCYLCTKFAKIVNTLSKGKITIIGLYSNKGEEIRKEILDESALDMFWLIDEKYASGGRTGIIPLIRAILSSKKKRTNNIKFEADCQQECKNVKSVFIRSASILSSSKKIKLK